MEKKKQGTEQMVELVNNPDEVLELVMFRLKEGTDPVQFVTAAEELEQCLVRQIPGFVRRSLLCTKDGVSWTDLIYWQDMQSAAAALKLLPSTMEFREFTSMVDPNDMVMRHLMPVQKGEKTA
ncbi:hypothetical protein ACX12E_11745 [Paenibacillus vandeheii]